MAQFDATKNRVDALAVVAVSAASLFITTGSYVVHQHGDGLERAATRLGENEIEIARLLQRFKDHNETAAHWIVQIIQGANHLHEYEKRLVAIETRGDPRPDPFTGLDGVKLHELIAVERKRIDDALKQLNKEKGL